MRFRKKAFTDLRRLTCAIGSLALFASHGGTLMTRLGINVNCWNAQKTGPTPRTRAKNWAPRSGLSSKSYDLSNA